MFKALKALLLGSAQPKPASARPKPQPQPQPKRQPQTQTQTQPQQQSRAGRSDSRNSSGDRIPRPSGKGQMTGYEPSKLRDFHAPISINAKGIAGLGLFQSGFSDRSVYSGQLGEVGFYKALCMTQQVDMVSSYWSVAMPADGTAAVPDAKFSTDIDCVVVQGENMYLIDLKYYASGDVTWHSSDGANLFCRDNLTGKQVGEPRKMSRNMAMAQDRFPKIFPNHRVSSYVVLIPTNSGLGNVQPGTEWLGQIPLITLPEMLKKIQSGNRGYSDAATDTALTSLLKD